MSQEADSRDFPLCFGCGQENPVGFHLRVHRDGDKARAEFIPGEYHTGWPGMVHGGVLLVLMDEVMNYLPYWANRKAVTGKMEARFRRPVPPGQLLIISAEEVRRKSRTMVARVTICLPDGTLVAEGESLILPLAQEG